MNWNANRRAFLRNTGLGAGALALGPVVQQLKARAKGKTPSAPRFVFVVESNGLPPNQIAPEGITRKPRHQRPLNGPAEFIDHSLKGRKLPMSLQPVAKWQDKMTIVQGLSGKVAGVGTRIILRHWEHLVKGREGNPPPSLVRRLTASWPNISAAFSRTLALVFPNAWRTAWSTVFRPSAKTSRCRSW